jgi:ribonuclease HI
LPESDRAEKIKELNFDKLSIERGLGVQWNVSTDQFEFSIVIQDRPLTRRGILSVVSSVFDPFGFVAAFILQAKRILQDLSRMKLDWDEPILERFQDRWQSWPQDLPKLEELEIDRCFKPNDEEVVSSQLHHFADAFEEGYGAVTYLRIENKPEEVKYSFAMGKSRLAPIKSVTIPRMELSAAVTAVKLLNKMCQVELSLPVEETLFWTDSTCVLKYLENEEKRFQTFVANRINVIREASPLEQ